MPSVNLYIPVITEIMPPKKRYLLRAGFKGKISLNAELRTTVNAVYKTGLSLACPRVLFGEPEYKDIPAEIIPQKFGDIKKMLIFISTLGDGIDEKINEYLASEKILHATLLDAWASESLEWLNECFDKRLREQHENMTMRFSPGYGDIDIRINFKLLELLNIQEIKANPHTGILTPRKSTICMIGVK